MARRIPTHLSLDPLIRQHLDKAAAERFSSRSSVVNLILAQALVPEGENAERADRNDNAESTGATVDSAP